MPTYAVARTASPATFHRRSYGTYRSATPEVTQVRKFGVYTLGGAVITPTKGQIWPLGSTRRRR